MANIELYIDRQLCDIENPNNFSVYLKRQLINPAELSTKDAQRSYDITLPASPTNNGIFGHTNTEEVKGKFARLYDAMLYVDGIKIFEGKFRMSEITKTYYKGNLGIPAQKTVKDIFGNLMMNQAGSWMIPFEGIEDMTKYNTGRHDKEMFGDIAPCIFPLVLYGLLPKEGSNTDKTVLDKSVVFGRDDFPPSINCLHALKRIFENKDLKISGSAFSDERLTNLYMSYKNPSEYEMSWNYGKLGEMKIAGWWCNVKYNMMNPPFTIVDIERNCDRNDERKTYIVDLLQSSLDPVTILSNNGNSVKKDSNNYTVITIPYSGLYKIDFEARVDIGRNQNGMGIYDENKVYNTEIHHIISPTSSSSGYKYYENLKRKKLEIKVLRNKKEDNVFDRSKVKTDNIFYRPNIDQNYNNNPKYFPQPGQVNFIDAAQNEYILCGLSFGIMHPLDKDSSSYCNPIATSGKKSWNIEYDKKHSYAATYSPGYIKQEINGSTITESQSKEFEVNLINTNNHISIEGENLYNGNGRVSQVVWLDKGEQITIISQLDEGYHYEFTGSGRPPKIPNKGWLLHSINFGLSIQAFQDSKSWLKIDENTGSSYEQMNWNAPTNLLMNQLDLARFLPSDMKINDWIDNFCKAFNLQLIQTDSNTFELNTNRQKNFNTSSIINLDTKADVNYGRKNTSIGLPSVYEIGYTIDKNEQGYLETGDDGSEMYETGSPESKRINQTSTFSYNWLKRIESQTDAPQKELYAPVITDKEIWEGTKDEEEMGKKDYKSKAQRFWYRKEAETYDLIIDKTKKVASAIVTNTFDNGKHSLRLNYKDNKKSTDSIDSILTSYFTLFTDADNCYTTVECYLTPEEYNNIGDSLIQLNGDLYYLAEIDGYDPLGKKKATLKLIRKFI